MRLELTSSSLLIAVCKTWLLPCTLLSHIIPFHHLQRTHKPFSIMVSLLVAEWSPQSLLYYQTLPKFLPTPPIRRQPVVDSEPLKKGLKCATVKISEKLNGLLVLILSTDHNIVEVKHEYNYILITGEYSRFLCLFPPLKCHFMVVSWRKSWKCSDALWRKQNNNNKTVPSLFTCFLPSLFLSFISPIPWNSAI